VYPFTARLALQACVALGATWAVGAGAWGVVDGIGSGTAGLVSQGRYLSGLLMAIGLGYWTTIADIEQKTARFRLLTGLVAIGGLSRLLGLAMGDGVSLATAGPLGLELGVAPLLCLWQNRAAPAFPAASGNRRDDCSERGATRAPGERPGEGELTVDHAHPGAGDLK
jgi:Domain of unknown function (DUF4345)